MSEGIERRSVHPTTDRTWRNTEYDLTKVPLEAARIFYRTRLEVSASDPAVEPWRAMLEVFLSWIADKELRRLKRGSECLMAQIPRPDGLMESGFVRGSFHHACSESYLRTEAAFAADDDVLPQHWALEYVERDGAFGYRFWVTEIGISDIGSGRLAVNARVRSYDDSTYIYEVMAPERNAPRFVKDLILTRGLAVTCGGMPLRTSAAVLTADNFDLFVEQLIDEERDAPLVVVSRNESDGGDPSYPVDPRELAHLLMGVAVVYALDRGDPDLERVYSYVFDNPEKPAYKYRLVPGCLRIFWGGVDLDNPTEFDYARHRFFTSEALEALGASSIIQNISAGVSRMFSLRAGEVLGIRTVGYQASLMRTKKLEHNRQALMERLREAEAWSASLEDELEGASNQSQLDAYRGQVELLNELLETADAEIRELHERQGQSSGGVSDDEYQLQAQDLERARYEALAAEDKALGLERDNGHLRYRVEQLEAQLQDEQAHARGNEARAQLFLEVGHELRDPAMIIDVAKRAFGDRLVFLDRAVDSACEYKGEPGELFDGLAAMYQHLWPMRFGVEGDAGIDEDAFQARSGFGLAFHESKPTNRNPRLVKQRAVEYHGKTYDISPHIKGGGRKRGHLRIHFFFDNDERMVVIGHCGNHMETDGTAKL